MERQSPNLSELAKNSDFQSQMAFATKSIAPELLRNNAALVANGAAGLASPGSCSATCASRPCRSSA